MLFPKPIVGKILRGEAPRVDVETLAALIPRSVEDALALLPEEEQRRYRECQESVIQARRSAERIEGQMWIG